MKEVFLEYPYDEKILEGLSAGDYVYISGPLLVMRDAAHKKFFADLDRTGNTPFNINGKIIYYMAPCPKRAGQVIGSCGPTTSKRMDAFTDRVYDLGVIATIGKGNRSQKVQESIKKNKKIYLAAVGGAGAFYSQCVKKVEKIAFEELLTEEVIEIEVDKFPCVVAIDATGKNIYS